MKDMYEAAQDLIASGRWEVDAENGLVYGRGGNRIGKYIGPNGYIRLAVRVEDETKYPYMHRVIWESVNGPIPEGLQVNHINGLKHDNRLENLEVVTAKENIQHAIATGLRLALPFLGPDGIRPRGEKSPAAKFSDSMVKEIRARYVAERVSQAQLSREYGVSSAHMSKILRGKTRTPLAEAA